MILFVIIFDCNLSMLLIIKLILNLPRMIIEISYDTIYDTTMILILYMILINEIIYF